MERYEALVARDRRFDGVFFVAVKTTGIYCRPICPARTPLAKNVEFFDTAALCEKAGYRACFRCRPELAPGISTASVDAVDTLVERAASRIAEGALDHGSVDDLARELDVSARQLRRAMEARLGVAPLELAQTHRLALAKQLIHDTELPITDVAFASGFRSVRRFNASFAERLGVAPIELRRRSRVAREPNLVLRLDYRAPFAWDDMLAFLRMRAIPGVEEVTHDAYRRVVAIDDITGVIEVRHAKARVELSIAPSLSTRVMAVAARVRRMFDLDARPDVIAAALSRDPLLAPLVAARPGLRVPGVIDPFEAAVRAMLGQQISVAAATTLAGRFAARFGTKLGTGVPSSIDDATLAYRFPTANVVAKSTPAAIAAIGLPGARAGALHALACAIATRRLTFDHRALDAFVASAVELPGIGPWTAHYLAMRALHLPDAFPAADLGIKHATGLDAKAAEARAEAWRPFRSYAVLHLWTGGIPHVARPHHDPVAARRAAAVRKPRSAVRRAPAVVARTRSTDRQHVARARRDRTPAR